MSKTVFSHLNESDGFRELKARADVLFRAQAVLDRQWPTLSLTIISLRQDTMVLTVTNSALAAKTRQFEPSLINAIRALHPPLARVRVKVQPVPQIAATPVIEPGDKQLGPDALEHLQDAATSLPPGRVKEALRRMLKRQLG